MISNLHPTSIIHTFYLIKKINLLYNSLIAPFVYEKYINFFKQMFPILDFSQLLKQDLILNYHQDLIEIIKNRLPSFKELFLKLHFSHDKVVSLTSISTLIRFLYINCRWNGFLSSSYPKSTHTTFIYIYIQKYDILFYCT